MGKTKPKRIIVRQSYVTIEKKGKNFPDINIHDVNETDFDILKTEFGVESQILDDTEWVTIKGVQFFKEKDSEDIDREH